MVNKNKNETTIAATTLRESEGSAPMPAAPRSRPSQVENSATSKPPATSANKLNPTRDVFADFERSISITAPTSASTPSTAAPIASSTFGLRKNFMNIWPYPMNVRLVNPNGSRLNSGQVN